MRCTLFSQDAQDGGTEALDLGAEAELDHEPGDRIDAVVLEELGALGELLVLVQQRLECDQGSDVECRELPLVLHELEQSSDRAGVEGLYTHASQAQPTSAKAMSGMKCATDRDRISWMCNRSIDRSID